MNSSSPELGEKRHSSRSSGIGDPVNPLEQKGVQLKGPPRLDDPTRPGRKPIGNTRGANSSAKKAQADQSVDEDDVGPSKPKAKVKKRGRVTAVESEDEETTQLKKKGKHRALGGAQSAGAANKHGGRAQSEGDEEGAPSPSSSSSSSLQAEPKPPKKRARRSFDK
ncbi:hypothetical protein DL93DRAFT_2079529 [Clavulina sp. PMI_390]|nr:hypothetical protein DL93DRAFT_2079529 [Clavulina sp. PMI_390]